MTSRTSSAGSAYSVPPSRNVRKRRTAAASTAAAVGSRIGALQLVCERGDLLDRSGQVLGAARLLRRRGGGLLERLRWPPRRPRRPGARRSPIRRRPRESRRRRARCSCWRCASRRPRRRASSSTAETARLFCTSISADAAICSRSLFKTAICSRTPRTVSFARSTLAEASRASPRMSFETIAKPRPDSPARAASTEPLTANMLVCTAISAIASTIFSIFRPTPPSWLAVEALACVSFEACAHAVDEALDGAAAGRQRRIDRLHALVRGADVRLGDLGALFDLVQRRRRLLRGGCLQSGTRDRSARPRP